MQNFSWGCVFTCVRQEQSGLDICNPKSNWDGFLTEK